MTANIYSLEEQRRKELKRLFGDDLDKKHQHPSMSGGIFRGTSPPLADFRASCRKTAPIYTFPAKIHTLPNQQEPPLEGMLFGILDQILTQTPYNLNIICTKPTLRIEAARRLYREHHQGKEPLQYNQEAQGWTTTGHPPHGLEEYGLLVAQHLSTYAKLCHDLETNNPLD
ncbi:MAG: hypothetical protein Q7R96_05645 [Nanoarchaeota archaeon]|nr:hypothetical protein [Nanoarchaeota archaeon]